MQWHVTLSYSITQVFNGFLPDFFWNHTNYLNHPLRTLMVSWDATTITGSLRAVMKTFQNISFGQMISNQTERSPPHRWARDDRFSKQGIASLCNQTKMQFSQTSISISVHKKNSYHLALTILLCNIKRRRWRRRRRDKKKKNRKKTTTKKKNWRR